MVFMQIDRLWASVEIMLTYGDIQPGPGADHSSRPGGSGGDWGAAAERDVRQPSLPGETVFHPQTTATKTCC